MECCIEGIFPLQRTNFQLKQMTIDERDEARLYFAKNTDRDKRSVSTSFKWKFVCVNAAFQEQYPAKDNSWVETMTIVEQDRSCSSTIPIAQSKVNVRSDRFSNGTSQGQTIGRQPTSLADQTTRTSSNPGDYIRPPYAHYGTSIVTSRALCGSMQPFQNTTMQKANLRMTQMTIVEQV